MTTASAKAKTTGTAVIVDAATTIYTTTVANPDGSFTWNESLEPQRVQQNNAWVPIDPTLIAGTGDTAGTWHTNATVAAITISGGGTVPLTTEDDGAGHVITTTWPLGALPTPTISGSTATYPGVLPGVDLQLTASATGVDDVLVVHDATAAANPALATLKLGVAGTGLTVSATDAGGIQATDAAGNVDFTGPTPMMWDSAGATTTPSIEKGVTGSAPKTEDTLGPADSGPSDSAHTAPMPATVSSDIATMTPSQALLTAPSTVWPVYLDPAIADAQPLNRTELWQCSAEANTSFFNGQNEGASNLNVNRVGWHTCGGVIRTLFQFDTSGLDTSGNSPDGNGAIQISSSNINLTSQYQCTPVEVWRVGPFNAYTTWADQNDSGQAIWSGSSLLSTTSCNSNSAGQSWSINNLAQLTNAMTNGWTNITVALKAHNEATQSSTTNYMAFYAINSGSQNAQLNVKFYVNPTVTSSTVGQAPIGNQGAQEGVCGTESSPAYLPMTSTPPQITVNVNDNFAGVTNHTLGVQGEYAAAGDTNPYAWYGSPQPFTVNSSGNATVQVPLPPGVTDGHTYSFAPDVWDETVDGPFATLATTPPPCWITVASTPPGQPQFSSPTFQAINQHLPSYNPAGTGGKITVRDTAPTTPIVRFDWILNGPSTSEGVGKCTAIAGAVCGSINGSTPGSTGFATTSASGPLVITPGVGNGEHWGDNYIFVSAVDAAGNISQFARYDYFLSQSFLPVSFGNITGDGTPNLLGVDNNGNLIVYPDNLDPTGSVNAVQVAAASAAPDGISWAHAIYTHRGAERVQPTDDLFALGKEVDGNNHLFYYYNSQQASASNQLGYTPPTPAPLNAFTQTQQATVIRPTCTPSVFNGECAGYDTTWNSVQQILAIGPVNGGCTITAPTVACKTNLLTVESYNGGPAELWMFSPAGIGQLKNPVLLSVSQPGVWDWSTVKIMAPGNASSHPGGAGGMPDLWAEDSSKTLWQFTNQSAVTGIPGAGIGNITARTRIGTAGEFAQDPWISTIGDLQGDGKPDLWVMGPDNQITVLFNPAGGSSSSDTVNVANLSQNAATGIGWANTASINNLQSQPIATSLVGQVVSAVVGGPSGQLCLDDLNGASTAGTAVDIYACNGTVPQGWSFNPDGTISITGTDPTTPPGACLDTSGQVTGTLATLQPCGTPQLPGSQTWHIIPSPSTPGTDWIYNPASGMCLDDTNGSTNNTNRFQIYQCLDNANQRFTLPPGPGQIQYAEAESLWGSSSGGTVASQTNCCGVIWSNGAQQMLTSTASGGTMTFNYFLPRSGTYTISPGMTHATDYGKVSLSVDSKILPNTLDAYQSAGVSVASFHFGAAALNAGMHTFTFTTDGTNAASTGNRYNIGVDYLALTPTNTTGPTPGLAMDDSAMVNIPVTADASGSFPGTAAIASYTFDFGDGTATGPQPGPTAQHTYTTAGTYVVKATVTDDSSASATTTAIMTVGSGTPDHWWKLADASGVTAADSGTLSALPGALSTPGVTLNQSGYATFAGAGGAITTSAPAIDTTKSFTVSAWANLASAGSGGIQTLLAQKAGTASGFYMEYNGSSWQFARALSDSTNASTAHVTSSSPAAVGTWTHLIGTYDSTTNTMAFYVNGQLVGTTIDHTPFASTGPVVMGQGFYNGAANNFFSGSLADVGIYQQPFSANLAQWLYKNSGFTQPTTPGIAGRLISANTTSGNPSRQVCVDDLNGSLANSTTIIDVYDCNGTWPQQWQFGTDGTIRLLGSNPSSPPNKCLDTGGVNTQGSKVTLYDCQAGNSNQVWQINASSTTPGQISLENPVSGLCLDNSGGSTSNSNPFQLYACLDNTNQHFTPPTGIGQVQSMEAEDLASPWGSNNGGSMAVQTNCCGGSWSNGAQLMLSNTAAGSTMTLNYYVANPGLYAIAPIMTKAADYGTVTVSVDGIAQPNTFDGYNNGVTTQPFTFGKANLTVGMHSFVFTVTGTNSATTGNRYNAGVDTLSLMPTAG
ncbi:hypothetical protein ABIA35_008093 [Catenulispora sp. MAP12-49]|uniref:ricin-type beta-trefoil lectin domain protein n=1 Tax=Catenulispora sp. MAP12-49 TaxID=3156302 RepID=UPI003519A4AA